MLRLYAPVPPFASAISPSFLASAADSNPKEDATSKDANPKGLESMSVPMLNVGLGALVACAGLATMLSEIRADIKLNHSVLTNKIDTNHREVTTKIDNGTLIFELKLKNLKLENSVSELTHDKIVKPTSKQ